ncbi:MAG: hypothetical protein QXR01_01320, partial [Candidatus Bathyarchaeia archaeon]
AGRTVWDMAEKFNVDLAEVNWEMLEKIKHKPIVLVRVASSAKFIESLERQGKGNKERMIKPAK